VKEDIELLNDRIKRNSAVVEEFNNEQMMEIALIEIFKEKI
jgi:hypothetical protein